MSPDEDADLVPDHLEVLPAVDISGGQAVQLVQGAAGSAKGFGGPLQAALRWQEAGAEWLHLATLDDIRALMDLVDIGVEGAIAGTALHEGRFTVEEALALTRDER